MSTGIGNVVGDNNIVTGNIGIANVGVPDSWFVDKPHIEQENRQVLIALSKLDSIQEYIEKHLLSIEFVDGYTDTFMWGRKVAIGNIPMVHVRAEKFSQSFLDKINRQTIVSAYVMEGAGGCYGHKPNFVFFIPPYVSSKGVSYTGVKITVGQKIKPTTTTGDSK
jgi:hypothetical protein